ncbi:respiratory chain complex I subunit 1 family protein [Azospirillum griseum]|nr:NADH-quinone oxidoreductase subunit H [Azospirillum griseum]
MAAVIHQVLHMVLVLALAPLLTGWIRLVKSRLVGRRGASVLQPYRDLARLLRKEVVLADNASWLFRSVPYVMFTAIWLAAGLVPVFTTDLALAPTGDLIALIALLGTARFFLALAGMDTGTSFGGIGSSREMMIAALAEPAMLMVVFSVAVLVRTTSLAEIAVYMMGGTVGLRVSLALALIALVMVAIAENARIPIDNPATHLELTMVHEAMVLEYSGRHLALIEGAAMLKLLLYAAVIACVFAPWGMATPTQGSLWIGLLSFLAKLATAGAALALFETSIAKMRVFRVGEFLGGALLLSLLGAIFLYVSRGV